MMNSDRDPFYGAPTVLVVLASKNSRTHIYDGSLVMGNLMNAAFSLGVDSCWIHRAKEVFETKVCPILANDEKAEMIDFPHLSERAMLYVVFGEILPQAILMYHSKLPAFSAIGGILVGMLIIF